MYQRKLCHFQYLKGEKNPITKQSSSKEDGKKEMGLMNNLSCPCRSVSDGHHLPGQRCACLPGEPSYTPRHNLLSPPTFLSAGIFGANTLCFMGWLQALPHVIAVSAKSKDNPAQQVLCGNQPWQWAKLKSIRAICHISLTCCLVFSPTSRFISGLQKIPQRAHAKGGKQTWWKYNLSIFYFFFFAGRWKQDR